MCEAIADVGYDVILLYPVKKQMMEKNVNNIYKFYNVKNNFKFLKLPWYKIKLKTFIYAFQCFLQIRKLKPDIIYSRFIIGSILPLFFQFKLIFELHAPIWESSLNNKILFNIILKSNYLDRLVFISHSLKNYFLNKFSHNYKMLKVAHDGAAVNFEKEKNSEIKWPGRSDCLQVGYIGNLYKGKGMEIISLLVDKLPDYDFHIIGGQVEDIEKWKAVLKNENIYFHGFKLQVQIPYYLELLDVCLLPNQVKVFTHGSNANKKAVDIGQFTSPLKLFEYMSAEKVIVASDIEVIREVLNDKNAILVDPSSIAE